MFNQAALLQRSGNTLKCGQYRDSEGAIAEGRRPLSILRQRFRRYFRYDVAPAAAACSRTFAALPASATPRSSIVAFVLGSTPQYP